MRNPVYLSAILLIALLAAGCSSGGASTPPAAAANATAGPLANAAGATTPPTAAVLLPTPAPSGAAPAAVAAATPAEATAGPAAMTTSAATATAMPAATVSPTRPAAAAAPAATARPAQVAAAGAGSGAAAAAVTAPAAAPLPAGVSVQLVAQGLTSPVTLVPAPDNSGRLFVVDQIGLVRIIGPDGKLQDAPFLDIRDRMVQLLPNYDERGLLGLAFHPDFAHNGRFFVEYSAPSRPGSPPGWVNSARLSEFRVAAGNANQADAASEKVLLEIDHPEANHQGGTIIFGPDGYLYLSMGDGGGANDTGLGHTPGTGNAQDLSKPLGKILRIDVNNQANGRYGIPADNPFANGPVPEIYAYGLRNPYRMSFDKGGNHELYAADAGQNLFEEVDLITKGGNYGWHIKEGTHCFDPASPNNPPATCPDTAANGARLIDPIIEYDHQQIGIVDIGGYVYRGQAIPGLAGRYVFGDWSTGYGSPDGSLLVSSRPASGQGLWPIQKLQIKGNPSGRLGHFVLGFGQDQAGEMYLLTSDTTGPTGNTGRVYKIAP